jgi:uncharacterized protein (TIRG00374 family)
VLRVGFTLFVIGGAVAAAVSLMGGISDAYEGLRHVRPGWLAAGLGSEFVAYWCLARVLRRLAGSRSDARRVAPFRTALLLFGLGSVLPAAPTEGMIMGTDALHRREFDRQRAALMLGLAQWFRLRTLLAFAAIAVITADIVAHLPSRYEAGLLAAAAVTVVVLVVTERLFRYRGWAEWLASVILRIRHWQHPPPVEVRRQRGAAWHDEMMRAMAKKRSVVALVAWSLAAWVADAACLFCSLRAVDARVALDIVLLAASAGTLLSFAPLLPGGVGLVETATSLLLHHYGVPFTAAIPAVISYRVIATGLPAVGGLLAVGGLRVQRSANAHAQGVGRPV